MPGTASFLKIGIVKISARESHEGVPAAVGGPLPLLPAVRPAARAPLRLRRKRRPSLQAAWPAGISGVFFFCSSHNTVIQFHKSRNGAYREKDSYCR